MDSEEMKSSRATDPRGRPARPGSPGGRGTAGLVLAAGESSRMGDTIKQLLPAGGSITVLERVLKAVLKSELDTVVLVLGYKADLVKDSLKPELKGDPRLVLVENPAYRDGLSTSLIAGLRAVAETHDRVMVLLGDMPGIHPGLINRLDREVAGSGRHLGAVRVEGRRSLPAVIGRRFYREVFELSGDVGAREFFSRYPGDVLLVDEDDYDDMDIDTPEDYRTYVSTERGRPRPLRG